jgi:hypothetical protein
MSANPLFALKHVPNAARGWDGPGLSLWMHALPQFCQIWNLSFSRTAIGVGRDALDTMKCSH